MIAAGVIGVLVGIAVLASMVVRPHPGKAHYQAYCGECHDREGALAIIDQRSLDRQRLFGSAHIMRHVADPEERAQLIAYFERELDR